MQLYRMMKIADEMKDPTSAAVVDILSDFYMDGDIDIDMINGELVFSLAEAKDVM
jgi:hypothetical protein